jgi:hypothetical protein
MRPRRRTSEHLVALVELVCGVVAAAYLIGVGIGAAGTGGRSAVDVLFPFVVAAAVGVGLVVAAVRRWRSAERSAEQRPPTPQETPAPSRSPGPPRPPAPHHPPAQREPAGPAPRPALSPEGRRELDRVVAVLAAAGVFAPRAPEPAQLSEAVADAGEPVLAETVLMAGEEAEFWHPGFRAADHSANLAFHDSHVEQFADDLQAQADDVVRLAGGGLAGVSVAVEIGDPDRDGSVPTRLRLAVDGEERVLDYPGASKYLSTVLHVALAGIARDRRSERRLAWLWSDQGVWLAGLADGVVERLNAVLGEAAGEGWEWVDEQQPTAAGRYR